MDHPDDHHEPDVGLPSQWRLTSDPRDDDLYEDYQAGPSDYWKRSSTPTSPSPSQKPPRSWRRSGDMPVDAEYEWPEDGPSDSFVAAPTYPQRPSKPSSRDEPRTDAWAADAEQRDRQSYEQRKQAILEDPSWETSLVKLDEQEQSYFGSYQENYKKVMSEGDGHTATAGDEEEEFGTPASPRRDRPESSYTLSVASMPIDNTKRNGLQSNGTPSKRSSFIHPSISRLRSHMRTPSSSSQQSHQSLRQPQMAHLRTSSHFSQISDARSETLSNSSSFRMPAPHSPSLLELDKTENQANPTTSTPAFVFHPLRRLSAHLFGRTEGVTRPAADRKTSFVFKLGVGRSAEPMDGSAPAEYGSPTVMDVRGMIAVGTENGYCIVYSFGQEVQHILGNEGSSSAVTTVTISNDQTYIAVGRASGNVHLYNLASPSKPARTTVALTVDQVLTGRKEGHLQNSRILHIGFVGARHTSIVTGDEHGRCFWWSLGRVVGVESNDVVRMLGSYPDPAAAAAITRKTSTLFAAHPLPLDGRKNDGPSPPRPIDSFNLSALLTPTKLVIVGMKPSPKTWYRKMRESGGDGGGGGGGLTGCALWGGGGGGASVILVYSWGSAVRLLQVTTENEGDDMKVSPKFSERAAWQAPDAVRALDWYDERHLLVVTTSRLVLVDIRSMTPVESTPLQTKLLTWMDAYPSIPHVLPASLQGSVRMHRNKLFILTRNNLQVGTLQHWNDRILACVHQGDFLGAIRVALTYYGEDNKQTIGNVIHLPDDVRRRRMVVSARLRELMTASLQWAFSPDRLTDDTHYSVDGRGVDLTGLFEGLASSCIEACLSIEDHDFMFDEAYEHFAQAGIHGIFLLALEPYIFSGRLRKIPPNVTQGLIAMHEQKGELDLAETVIWNVDPMSLDINQAIVLCEGNGLWDAMIHVYTRAMKDYIAPLVKLIGVVRDIQHHRLRRPMLVVVEGGGGGGGNEELAPNAYKLYAYIEATLSGVSYPSGEPLPEAEGYAARSDVYTFIFQGRTIAWPLLGGGDLVLTGEEGSVEPPYPYLSLLLRFDTEAFLHSMDIAFEDPYLNDTTGAINRQSIVNLMLDVMDPEYFHPGDITFLHIFVARNLPKYPQFLFIPPSTLHRILVSLASDPDQSTREDRQLAAEYLLSAYKPHDSDAMLRLFDQAGFFRILRGAYRKEGKWARLVSTLLKDPDAGGEEVFASLDEIVRAAGERASDRVVVQDAIVEALPQLFDLGVRETALLVDRDLPNCHGRALHLLTNAPHKQLAYLRCLLEPTTAAEDVGVEPPQRLPSSSSVGGIIGSSNGNVDRPERLLYISLLSQQEPERVLPFLDKAGERLLGDDVLPELIAQCAEQGSFEPQMWALDKQGRTGEALEVARDVLRVKGVSLGEAILSLREEEDWSQSLLQESLDAIQQATRMAVRLCQEYSGGGGGGALALGEQVEDMWLGVLHDIIELVHSTSSLLRSDGAAGGTNTEVEAINTLRSLVQETLASLLSSSSSSLSFPRLFKRLVDASTTATITTTQKGRAYSEFRTILTGMLDSYRAEREMLGMTTRLVEADLHRIMANLVSRREKGWRPDSMNCRVCKLPAFDGEPTTTTQGAVVQGSGMVAHQLCVTKM
ncbi:hypothetical protein I317_01189 [Kwoniella heveanensis CBS 569]|nr:hypothetical protein I317_01189 [Kwoniella heveanensis CBS 569]